MSEEQLLENPEITEAGDWKEDQNDSIVIKTNQREDQVAVSSVETDLEEESEAEDESGENNEEEAHHGDSDIEELPLPEEDPELQDDTKKKDFILKRKEKQLQRMQEENALLKSQTAQQLNQNISQQPVALPNIAPPNRDDFDNDDDYLDARLDYRDAIKNHKEQQKNREQVQFKIEQERVQKFHQAMENGANKYGDFEDVIAPIFGPTFPRNELLADAIADSDFKEDILYFMGKNIDHARKVASMNPINGVKEIAKLEQRFAEKRKASKVVTANTHKPMQTIKGAGGSSASMTVNTKDIDKMSQSDYEQWRKKSRANKSVW